MYFLAFITHNNFIKGKEQSVISYLYLFDGHVIHTLELTSKTSISIVSDLLLDHFSKFSHTYRDIGTAII
jgi:hypothetical protein